MNQINTTKTNSNQLTNKSAHGTGMINVYESIPTTAATLTGRGKSAAEQIVDAVVSRISAFTTGPEVVTSPLVSRPCDGYEGIVNGVVLRGCDSVTVYELAQILGTNLRREGYGFHVVVGGDVRYAADYATLGDVAQVTGQAMIVTVAYVAIGLLSAKLLRKLLSKYVTGAVAQAQDYGSAFITHIGFAERKKRAEEFVSAFREALELAKEEERLAQEKRDSRIVQLQTYGADSTSIIIISQVNPLWRLIYLNRKRRDVRDAGDVLDSLLQNVGVMRQCGGVHIGLSLITGYGVATLRHVTVKSDLTSIYAYGGKHYSEVLYDHSFGYHVGADPIETADADIDTIKWTQYGASVCGDEVYVITVDYKYWTAYDLGVNALDMYMSRATRKVKEGLIIKGPYVIVDVAGNSISYDSPRMSGGASGSIIVNAETGSVLGLHQGWDVTNGLSVYKSFHVDAMKTWSEFTEKELEYFY